LFEQVFVIQRQARWVLSETDVEGCPRKCGGKNECHLTGEHGVSTPPTDRAYPFTDARVFISKKIAMPILLCIGLVLGGRLAPAQRRRCSIIAGQAIFCLLYRLAIDRLCECWSTQRKEHDQRYTKSHLSSYTALLLDRSQIKDGKHSLIISAIEIIDTDPLVLTDEGGFCLLFRWSQPVAVSVSVSVDVLAIEARLTGTR
jgi:hypothetical protein